MSSNVPAKVSYFTGCGNQVHSGARYCEFCGQVIRMALPPAGPNITTPVPVAIPTTIVIPDSGGGASKLFSKWGRIGRLEFFLMAMGTYGIASLGTILLIAISDDILGVLLSLAVWIVAIFIYACAGIKRLHDFDQSGWLILLNILIIPGIILFLLMLFKGPSRGINRYGYPGSGSPF